MYHTDLAYIHDRGFGEFSRTAASGLLKLFENHGIHQGRVVDLGCGSGIWAKALSESGYQIHGIDISQAMIEFAKERVPEGSFEVGSIYSASFPSCQAVTAIGECLSYLEKGENRQDPVPLFLKIFDSLTPGGLFVFDALAPGQLSPSERIRNFHTGEDWAILIEKREQERILTREITLFRKINVHYRRSEETHRLSLRSPERMRRMLEECGFEVIRLYSYGEISLQEGHYAFLATKPVGLQC